MHHSLLLWRAALNEFRVSISFGCRLVEVKSCVLYTAPSPLLNYFLYNVN